MIKQSILDCTLLIKQETKRFFLVSLWQHYTSIIWNSQSRSSWRVIWLHCFIYFQFWFLLFSAKWAAWASQIRWRICHILLWKKKNRKPYISCGKETNEWKALISRGKEGASFLEYFLSVLFLLGYIYVCVCM